MTDEADRLALARHLYDDRWFAHRHLFAHRHPDESPEAHRELVSAINRPDPRVSIEGFRRLAKTTYLEETALLKAAFREFHNLVIIGPSFPRACDRVEAIANEIDVNPNFSVDGPFGDLRQRGEAWQSGKIVLAGDICIQALGREQSITGLKFRQWRPDAFLIDDIEDPEETRTDAEREGTWRWLMQTFLPCLDDVLFTWGRYANTRRGSNSLPQRLEESGVPTVKFPIERIGDGGERVPTWPAMFPIKKIDQIKELYRGNMDLYAQEFMCEATSAVDRTFRRETMHVVPRVRTWEACYAMYDPARTVGAKSATTGKAVWSWLSNRLVIWDAAAELWLPDALIADIFETNERFGPIWIGVEEDGLNEWIRQPLRHEQVHRGATIPIRPLRAPRGKLDFIRGLQSLFAAGEVEFALPLPDLEAQLLSFPHGRIDAPNALAYALNLKPGQAIYDNFTQDHVVEPALIDRTRPLWLACNATRGLVTAVALQYWSGRTRILGDWAFESEPAEAVPLLVREVGMTYQKAPTVCCGAQHYDRYMNIGLVQAFQRVPLTVEAGVDTGAGRTWLRDELGRLTREVPAVQIGREAKLTLNALAGGYARMLGKSGGLGEEAELGIYRVLMEGLEACLGRMAMTEEIDSNANYSFTPDGRRYMRYGNPHAARAR
jgi:hypothetical protein